MIKTTRPGRKRLAWLGPFQVALLGTVVVVLLLTLPIHTRGPGDHELKSCGNALALDLQRWRFVPDGADAYFEPAFRHCTAQRVDRIALAVGVLAVTMLVATLVAGRRAGRGAGRSAGRRAPDEPPVRR